MISTNIGLERLVKDSIEMLERIKLDSNDKAKEEIESLLDYYKKYEEQFKESSEERDRLIEEIAELKLIIEQQKEKFNTTNKMQIRHEKIKSGEIKPALKVSDADILNMRKAGMSSYKIADRLGVKSAGISYRVNKIVNKLHADGVSVEDISKELNLTVEEVKSKIK